MELTRIIVIIILKNKKWSYSPVFILNVYFYYFNVIYEI
jgi:hypothetical protein